MNESLIEENESLVFNIPEDSMINLESSYKSRIEVKNFKINYLKYLKSIH